MQARRSFASKSRDVLTRTYYQVVVLAGTLELQNKEESSRIPPSTVAATQHCQSCATVHQVRSLNTD